MKPWMGFVVLLIILMGIIVTTCLGQEMLGDSTQPTGENCPWADVPCIFGNVFNDSLPLLGVLVTVQNLSTGEIYLPFAPDHRCKMPDPETQTHLCCSHGAGAWDSFWEDTLVGWHPPRFVKPGDIIAATASYDNQQITVIDAYNGDRDFQMPDIIFSSSGIGPR